VFNKFVKALFFIAGGGLGYYGVYSTVSNPQTLHYVLIPSGSAVVAAVLGHFFLKILNNILENGLQKTTGSDLLAGSLGLIFGVVVALLLCIPLYGTDFGRYFALFCMLVIGSVSAAVAVKKRDDLLGFFSSLSKHQERQSQGGTAIRAKNQGKLSYKVVDTSAIIDGRIADICHSGFIEGILIIPSFVLAELQRIADSSDTLKRNRGRRGLDILNRMQKEEQVNIRIYEKDFDDLSDVDTKLVRLAKQLDARVITNDFNLNKVAELYGVHVLNINELSNAVKPIVLPGEEMVVHVIKDGKELGQGVAYLEDGTMIVVDGGRQFMGETIGVLVTSVLQTAAGRMIFAKPKQVEHIHAVARG
jgi:uncharacterized protein YacL